jgi:biopolymer transport protein ExbB/TolQ
VPFAVMMTPAVLVQSQPDGLALGDFWSLTQQAGPLRWPIFVVLGFGLMQVFLKLYELVRDRRVSAGLYSTDLAPMSLDRIVGLVERQEESMLSTLQSTMLNVFQTRPGEGLLHDEISNFVSFQQDQFSAFQRRMDFLSDTAGALGLMGTVWGMFTVFFQGTSEQDVILRGMGIALITTLLGLVVSIILNFSAMEVSTFFGKRLEQVSRKSDELRFRLMELAPKAEPPIPSTDASMRAVTPTAPRARDGAGASAGEGVASPPAPSASVPESAPVSTSAKGGTRKAKAGTGNTKAGTAKRTKKADGSAKLGPAEAAPAPKPVWHYVEMENGNGTGRAGSVVSDLGILVRDSDGKPAAGVPVIVAVSGTEGDVGGGERSVRRASDSRGRVGIECSLPRTVGAFALEVSLPEQAGPSTRLEVLVHAADPAAAEAEGNNQAAVAGMKLPLPLGVLVSDRFGNPVADVPVGFAVTQGEGKLASGTSTHEVASDASGRAATAFVVSSEAGQNGVRATVEGTKHSVDFIAFGTEV